MRSVVAQRAGLAVAACVLTGCGTTVAGTAEDAPTSFPSSAAAASSGPPSSSASEPSSVVAPLAGRDPCTAIPEAVLASLGSAPAKLGVSQTGATEFTCSYRDFNSPYGSSLTFDAQQNYAKYGEPADGVIVNTTEVSGLSAFAVQKPSRAVCVVAVDAGPSQSFAVTRIGSFSDPIPPLCDKASAFAAAAVAALASN